MPLFLEADAALSRINPSVSSGVTWTPTSFMFGRWRATGGIDSPSGSCTRGLRLLQKMQQLEDAQVSNASFPSHSSSGPVACSHIFQFCFNMFSHMHDNWASFCQCGEQAFIMNCVINDSPHPTELHGWHGQHGKESIEDLPNQVWACRVPQSVTFPF
ncbi:hypothetical protein ACQJBY_036610 [Aegilops geniculata]